MRLITLGYSIFVKRLSQHGVLSKSRDEQESGNEKATEKIRSRRDGGLSGTEIRSKLDSAEEGTGNEKSRFHLLRT